MGLLLLQRCRWSDSASGREPVIQQHLYLFNIIVALEWQPGERYLRQLKAAFRRASDFLYDVTDGYMAFGQVLFGGPELMDCADIQIMASNRLLPRSWVSGLVNEKKYLPIRMGRAAWHKNNRVSIPWTSRRAIARWCMSGATMRWSCATNIWKRIMLLWQSKMVATVCPTRR